MSTPRIVAFAGSLRTGSYNKMAVKIAAEGARAAGAEVTFIDLRDFPMPIYDEDLEKSQGIPAAAQKFKDLLVASQGMLIASPEYNSSVSAVLKNAIDWASRQGKKPDGSPEAPLAAFNHKVCGLVAASPGALGGLRGLVHARAILGNINVLVLPDQVAVQKAHEVFNPDGTIKDEKIGAMLKNVGARVAHVAGKLHG
jgi:NAD(P)H-dependent FMN reductase